MVSSENSKPISTLVLTGVLSCSLTIVICITYIVLCSICLIFEVECDGQEQERTSYFWNVIYTTYIQECTSNETRQGDLQLTTHYTVFVLLILTITASAVCLIMASIVIAALFNKASSQYASIIVYVYIGFSIASLVVDLTFASHFGMDYMYMNLHLGPIAESAKNYAIYYGSFVLMTISLKGYVYHAINLVLLVLLGVYAYENGIEQREKHSIHKMGALNAFEPNRKPDDNWTHHPNYPPFSRSPHINNGFINDEEPPHSPARDILRSDYTPNRSFDRSDSWHRSRGVPDHGQGSRPFSYLEDIKRPVPVRPPASPSVDPHWRRDPWPPSAGGPPLPAPDYSPQTPRRLKSALKSGYM